MIHELDVYGLLVPPILVWTGMALVVAAPLRLAMGRLGLYRFVWHKPLFDLALLVIVLGVIVAAAGS
jgi:Protein of unknown function (DUF1656)